MSKPPFSHILDPLSLPAALQRPVLAIGNFDGMHRGHRKLVDAAIVLGKRLGHPSGILTFDPHPRRFFQPEQAFFQLTPPEMKAGLAQGFGLDGLVTLSFTRGLAALTAEEFVSDILVRRLNVSGVVVGYDFHFGKGRMGSPAMLQTLGETHGFDVIVMTPQAFDGDVVSSTLIRQCLSEGDVVRANTLLGHIWRIKGEVRHGDKRGRELGYPTANIHLDKGVTLKHGIYAVRAMVDGKTHAAVASFGRRPTFDDGAPRLEVHVFDFAGDLYGKSMNVAFVGYIRPELKFDGIEALIHQMDQDSLIARDTLAKL